MCQYSWQKNGHLLNLSTHSHYSATHESLKIFTYAFYRVCQWKIESHGRSCTAVMKFTRVYIAARLFVHSTRNSSFQRIICRIVYTRHCSVNSVVMFICCCRSIYFFKKWFVLSGSDIKNRDNLMRLLSYFRDYRMLHCP